jgi:protein-S-isoprenylcysteine O-methyltransferase Ste14
MRDGFRDSPNRIPWPPILLGGAVVGGLLLNGVLPALYLGDLQGVVGLLVFGAGVGLVLWAFRAFRAARANILPHRPADALLTEGPFAISRNPIYAGEVLAFIGLGLATGSTGLIVAGLALGYGVEKLAIEREEIHLQARFGEAYAAYAARVRRWL